MQELDRLYAMRGHRKYQEIVVPADGVFLQGSSKPALSASHLVRNALTRIFKRHFGMTITEWLASEADKSGRPSTAVRQRRQATGIRSDSQPTPRTA